ncbi:MAG TPA: MFS transporter [Alphaproteobacteria bacterium]|nr:MFS transporter [Alphaproteobacteria bacterium]
MISTGLASLKRRPVALIAIGYMFTTNLDSIFVIPLLPVLHGGTPGQVARDVAFALSIRLGASLLLSLLLPVLAPRADNARLLLASSLMKAAAFASILALPTPLDLWCFAFLAGAGTGALRPIVRAVIADETRGREQALAFQGLFLAMNLAFVLGPLLAEVAIRLGRVEAGLVMVTALELGAGLAAYRLIPSRVGAGRPQDEAIREGRPSSGLELRLWLVMGQTLLAYAAVGFLIASLVLYQSINPPLAPWRNLLLSAEGLAVIAVQIALMPLFCRLPRGLAHATIALSTGVGLALCFSVWLPLVFVGLALFALGECLVMPLSQLELSEQAAPWRRRRVFAMAMVAAALGEIAGAWLAFAVSRADALRIESATAAQILGVLIGCALAMLAWASVRRRAGRARSADLGGRLAEERR